MLVQGHEVAQWVLADSPAELSRHAQGIGFLVDGKLIAGCAYDSFNPYGCYTHFRVDKTPPREFWVAMCDYPFNALKLPRVRATVRASNEKAIKLNKHLGWQLEATLKQASVDGSDMLVMVMEPEDCRILKWRKKNEVANVL